MKRGNAVLVSAMFAAVVAGAMIAWQNQPAGKLIAFDSGDTLTGKTRGESSDRPSGHDFDIDEVDTATIEERIAEHACKQTAETGLEKLLEDSDDFCANKGLFVDAARRLLAQETCSETDLRMNRGWARAPERGTFHFSIYCDDFNEKLYLDATLGRIYSAQAKSETARPWTEDITQPLRM